MITKKLEHGFVCRTLLYGAAGLSGVTIDTVVFFMIASTRLALPIAVINVFTYSLGTIVSYIINKKLSFRSKTHRLSFRRFYITSVFGMLLSTVILSILTDSSFGIPYAKIIATMAAASTQYAINTKFSLVLSQLK